MNVVKMTCPALSITLAIIVFSSCLNAVNLKDYTNIFQGLDPAPLKKINNEIETQAPQNQAIITRTLEESNVLLGVKGIESKELQSVRLEPMLFNRMPELTKQLNKVLRREQQQQPVQPATSRAEKKSENDAALERAIQLSKQTHQQEETERAELARALKESKEHKTAKHEQSSQHASLRSEIVQKDVLPQKNADCGFHAVLNALWCELLGNGNIDEKQFSADIMAKSNEEKIQAMQKLIETEDRKEKREGNKKWVLPSGWIHGDAVNYLMEHEKLSQTGQLVKHNPQAGVNPNYSWTIMENITAQQELVLAHLGILRFGAPFSVALHKLRTQPNAWHIFLLCNTNYEENLKAEKPAEKWKVERGHWITVLVRNKNNKQEYIALDSLNGDTTNSVNALENLITSANLDHVKIIETGALVDAAFWACDSGHYEDARKYLNQVHETLEQWRAQKVSNTVVQEIMRKVDETKQILDRLGI